MKFSIEYKIVSYIFQKNLFQLLSKEIKGNFILKPFADEKELALKKILAFLEWQTFQFNDWRNWQGKNVGGVDIIRTLSWWRLPVLMLSPYKV